MPPFVHRIWMVALTALLWLPSASMGQSAPSVSPSRVEVDRMAPATTVDLTGRGLDVWRQGWVTDARGQRSRDFDTSLGPVGRRGERELGIRMMDAPPGRYRVVLSDGKAEVTLRLDVVVLEEKRDAPALPPEEEIPEAPLVSASVKSSYSTANRVVLGRSYQLEVRTNFGDVAPGQTVRLTSSDPSLLPVPVEVPLDDFQYTMVALEAPAATDYDPPYPKAVTLTAESGGTTVTAEALVFLDKVLESVEEVPAYYESYYPARLVLLRFEVDEYDGALTGHSVQLSTDRPEVWDDFPTEPLPTHQNASLRLGVYAEGGPVQVTASDGIRSHSLTLELAKPQLTGVDFELSYVDGGSQGREWVTQLEGDQVGVHQGASSFYEGAVKCAPTFDFEPVGDDWTETVTLTTDRPDLVTLNPAEVTFDAVGMAPITSVNSPCDIDFSTITAPTPVTVTATYGDQTASGTLELLPSLPSVSIVTFRDFNRAENWAITEGSTAEMRIYLDHVAPPGTQAEITMEWVNTAFEGLAPDPADVLHLPSTIDLSGYGGGDYLLLEVTAGALPEGFAADHAQVRWTMTIGTQSDVYSAAIWRAGG